MEVEKNVFVKTVDLNLQTSIFNLLDTLSVEKQDEQVKVTIESSLAKISNRKPDEVISIFCYYKKKNPKLTNEIVAVILRIIQHCTSVNIRLLETETVLNCIDFTVSELIRYPEQTGLIQKPCEEVLVSIGRFHCKHVMDALVKQLGPHKLGHFMILHTMGYLATSNMSEIIPYIKTILGIIIPMLSLLKQDYVKQAYSYAIHSFCDAILEYQSNVEKGSTGSMLSNEPDISNTTTASVSSEDEGSTGIIEEGSVEDSDSIKGKQVAVNANNIDISVEIGITYDVLMQQWLASTRDTKLASDILYSLSMMYPLLPVDKIMDQINKIIPMLLNMYRRSVDRTAATNFLASVIKTNLKLDPKMMDSQSDTIINTLFDLISVNPDYENPHSSKSHFEVLRCYALLAKNYGEKILDVLLIRLRSNDEREKIKCLLLLTYLTNSKDDVVFKKIREFKTILRVMITSEKTFKMKMILLKTIIAFAQKSFIDHKIFVKFLLHHCCHLTKISPDQGTSEEAAEFVTTCNNSLVLLSRTVSSLDNLLKIELLHHFLLYEYTEACGTIAKCLAGLFSKNPDVYMGTDALQEDAMEASADSADSARVLFGEQDQETVNLPSAESIVVRSMVLCGNFDEKERIGNILKFLLSYSTNLHKYLQPVWEEQIKEMQSALKFNDDDKFYKDLYQFVRITIKVVDDQKFPETLVNKMSDQIILYTPPTSIIPPVGNNQLLMDLKVSSLHLEKGMLLKLLGLCLCYVTDLVSIESKIDLILSCVKNDKFDKSAGYKEYEEKFLDPAKSLGFVSSVHYDLLLKKIDSLVNEDSIKKSGSFFSGLNFNKDSIKESEKQKIRYMVVFAFSSIVENTPKHNILNNKASQNDKVYEYLCRLLIDMRECNVKKMVLTTFLKVCEIFLETSSNEKGEPDFKYTSDLLTLILKIPIENVMGNSSGTNYGNFGFYDYLPLYPTILKVAAALIKLSHSSENENDGTNLLDITAHHFFAAAQNLNTSEEDHQSYLAPHINNSIPELNNLIKVLLERNPTPAGLDDVIGILEQWLKDKNSQVRICTSLVLEATLDSYIKSMKIGYEQPSKFNQTGSLLGKIVPRCIDSSGRVREISINILKKVMEIACIYETLTIPEESMEWMQDLKEIRDTISIEDNKTVIQLANKIAHIISMRLTNMQYVHFSKTLLYSIKDSDVSASAGTALILNYFIQFKGSEMFHAVPDLVKDSLLALKISENSNAKKNIFKALLSLTKHHPKLVCNEMLIQPLPYDEYVIAYWKSLITDKDLIGIILDNFLSTIFTACPYESPADAAKDDKIQKVLANMPFAIVCALKEIMIATVQFNKENEECPAIFVLKSRFPIIFCMLMTTLATYTNSTPSMTPAGNTENAMTTDAKVKSASKNKTKFSFIPNRDVIKINPCVILLDTFIHFLDCLKMEQLKNVLTMSPQLASSGDLNNFMEFIAPMAIAVGNFFNINSSTMKQIITELNRYMDSTCDPQRIAAIGFYSQLVPLHPCGEVSSVIMLHLLSALSDPNALVRGFCVRGLAFTGALTDHDIEKYAEMSLSALLKGIDDYNANCLINIPLESLRGLSRILEAIPSSKLEMFEVSLTIRIRPFFENESIEIREAAILLFGDLCHQTKLRSPKSTANVEISDELREQLISNLFPLFLHLGENESIIARACKLAIRSLCALMPAKILNNKVQEDLQDFHQLNYESFLNDFVRMVSNELNSNLTNFIETCLPYLKSQWTEIRGFACITIGLLHNFGEIENEKYRVELESTCCTQISKCLKDEQLSVRVKAAEGMGLIFSK